MSKPQKLELTWIGKDEQPRLEPLSELEGKDERGMMGHQCGIISFNKKEGAIEDSDVQEKTQAALQYCKYATEFTTQNSGKQWKYVLIPHNMVQVNMSFNYLVRACEA